MPLRKVETSQMNERTYFSPHCSQINSEMCLGFSSGFFVSLVTLSATDAHLMGPFVTVCRPANGVVTANHCKSLCTTMVFAAVCVTVPFCAAEPVFAFIFTDVNVDIAYTYVTTVVAVGVCLQYGFQSLDKFD